MVDPITTTSTAAGTLELKSVLIPLIPVAVGGLITLFGVMGKGLLDHSLKSKADKEARRTEKFEELLDALYAHKIWLTEIRMHHVHDAKDLRPAVEAPIAKMRSIVTLYFPESKGAFSVLVAVAFRYEVWVYRAGVEKIKEGKLTKELNDEGVEIIAIYTNLLERFVEVVENRAFKSRHKERKKESNSAVEP